MAEVGWKVTTYSSGKGLWSGAVLFTAEHLGIVLTYKEREEENHGVRSPGGYTSLGKGIRLDVGGEKHLLENLAFWLFHVVNFRGFDWYGYGTAPR